MTGETPSRRLRLEALLAYPPTKACREVTTILKSFVAEYADRLRLDIYYAGEAPSATPTAGYQNLDKQKTIPSAYVNGRMIIDGDVPPIEKIRGDIEAELARGPSAWED